MPCVIFEISLFHEPFRSVERFIWQSENNVSVGLGHAKEMQCHLHLMKRPICVVLCGKNIAFTYVLHHYLQRVHITAPSIP